MSNAQPSQPLLLDLYANFLKSQDTVSLIYLVSKRYTPSTLERLAQHGNCEIRRAAVFTLGFLGDFAVNPVLGNALNDSDRSVRLLAGMAIRSVWNRDGNKDQRKQLTEIIRRNAIKCYTEAHQLAASLLEEAPWFAEVWYQRGSARFQLEDFAGAIRDFHRTLELNPYQFVAATAIGQAYLRLDNPVSTLNAFRHALRLNPDQEKIRAQVAELTRRIDNG
jgi:tetratricopeptide (TPR) repeat protein